MEKSITIRGREYPLEKLKEKSTPLSPFNERVYSALSDGVLISDASVDQLEAILDTISALCGYPIQKNKIGLLNALKTHLTQFGFAELTDKEITLAFHLNCEIGLKYPSGMEQEIIYNHSLELSVMYIAKVLSMYMNYRKILIRKLENDLNGYE